MSKTYRREHSIGSYDVPDHMYRVKTNDGYFFSYHDDNLDNKKQAKQQVARQRRRLKINPDLYDA